jgi:hypothetical protein
MQYYYYWFNLVKTLQRILKHPQSIQSELAAPPKKTDGNWPAALARFYPNELTNMSQSQK